MCVVAVPGGTGSIGKTIVEQLQITDQHEVLILTRKVPRVTPPRGTCFIEARYDDVQSLADLLESHNVDTVINAMILHEGTLQHHLNLIEAAHKSSKTRRFIPSEFGVVASPELEKAEPEFAAPFVKTAKALKASNLQYSHFVIGFIMDYWGMPHIQTNMAPFVWAVNPANYRAAIPASGNFGVSMILSVDLARFIVRSLESDDWPEWSYVVGSDVTANELLALCEEVRGRKFDVGHDDEEKLLRNESTPVIEGKGLAKEWVQLAALFGRLAVDGHLQLPRHGRLNEKYPDIQPTTLQEVLDKAWAGRSTSQDTSL